ncbi:predicted protein [Naegleria gruberi]|uniref:Predicted protein n=1 Tax=Naegleria gruberi TaxID=5762 RepID=D2V9T6_NAEGR|nr:uncharacterized protein NAEGRDRAFT_65623 [Naegleria gruberi]EFC46196.1 predicted protein [Naegleria gruberi]|eukprot:XP_002678940.1 predicted protein [Naegleria gruberi strain NEG-M]
MGISISIRLIFHAYNLSKQDEEGNSEWESRDVYIFYLEIISELLQSLVYLSFFLLIMTKFGLPFHLLRNIYITLSNVKKKILDLYNYRRASLTLDQKFENATQNDLDEFDGVCVICREDMITNTLQNPIKKLPCKHLFHSKCLRGCLERSQECPICGRSIDLLLKEQEDQLKLQQQLQLNNLNNLNNNNGNVGHHHHHTPTSTSNTTTTTTTSTTINNINNTSSSTVDNNITNLFTSQQEILNQMNINLIQQQQQQQPLNLFNSTTTINDNQLIETNEKLQQVMIDMYIRYLESMKDNINQTLEQLKQLNDFNQSNNNNQ